MDLERHDFHTDQFKSIGVVICNSKFKIMERFSESVNPVVNGGSASKVTSYLRERVCRTSPNCIDTVTAIRRLQALMDLYEIGVIHCISKNEVSLFNSSLTKDLKLNLNFEVSNLDNMFESNVVDVAKDDLSVYCKLFNIVEPISYTPLNNAILISKFYVRLLELKTAS